MDTAEEVATTLSRGTSARDLPCHTAAGDLRALVAACVCVSGEDIEKREASSSPEVAGRYGALENRKADHLETSSKAKVGLKGRAVTTMASKPLSDLNRLTFALGSDPRPCPDGLMQLRQAFQPYLGGSPQEMRQSDAIQGDQRTVEQTGSAAGAKPCGDDEGLLDPSGTDGQEPGNRRGIDELKVPMEHKKWPPPECNEEVDLSNAVEYKEDGRCHLTADELPFRASRGESTALVERREENSHVHISGGGPAPTSSEELDDELGERPRKRKAIQEVLQNVKVPDVQVLIEKLLTISDTDKRGCIALPKGPVEEHLPVLEKKEGMELQCEDSTGQQWTFQFRFWTLKHHRTYILQHTLDYVRAHKIVAGDTLQLCRAACGKLVIKVRRGKSPGRPGMGKWGGHKMGSAHKFGTLPDVQKALSHHDDLQDGEGGGKLMIEMPSSKGDEQRDGEVARKDAGVLVKGFLAGKRRVETRGDSFWERGWSSVQKRSPHQKRKLWGIKGPEGGSDDVNVSDSNGGYREKSYGSGGTMARHEGGMAMVDVLQRIDQQKRSCPGGIVVSGSEDTDEDWQPDGQKTSVRKARRAMSAGRPRRNTVPMQWLMSDYDVCEKQSRKRKVHNDLDLAGMTPAIADGLRGKELEDCSREHHGGGCGCDGSWTDTEMKQITDRSTFGKKHQKKAEESQRPRLMLEQCCAWKIVGQPGCPEKAASGSAYCWHHMPSKHQKGGGGALMLGDAPKKMHGKQKRGARGPRGLLLVPWRGREATKLVKALGRARKERLAVSTELKVVENGEFDYETPVRADDGNMQMEVGASVVPDKLVDRELLCNKGNGGKTWRCGRKRIPGRVFCEVHAKNLKKFDKPPQTAKDGGTGAKQTVRKTVDAREMNMELPPEGQRCNKSNGAKSWRCSRFRLPGRAFCEVHCTFPKSDRTERRMRCSTKALVTVPTEYIADVYMGMGESSHASREHLAHMPLPSGARECAFGGGHQPCPLPAEPGHLACARHMKPGMMRQARLLKKAKYSGKPCNDSGRGSAEEEPGMLCLESPAANISTSPPELTLASPADMASWWTRTSQIPDSMVALAHAASQASMEDAVLKAGNFSGGSENAVADEQGAIIAMMCSDRGLEPRPSLSILGDFVLDGGGMGNGSMEESLQMYRDGRGTTQENGQEGAWRKENRMNPWSARRGVEGGRLSPDEGASVAASAITCSRQDLLTDGRVNLSSRGMTAMLDASKWDGNGGPFPGGDNRHASLDVERSSLSGITHSGIASKADLNKQLEKRPEMRGLQLSRSALGSVYSRWGNSEEMQVPRVAPSAAWQDRLPERLKGPTLPHPDVNGRQPVMLDGVNTRKQQQSDDQINDNRSRLPPRKRQGLQLFGVYLQGGTQEEQQHGPIAPLLQQSLAPASASGPPDVLRPAEAVSGSQASPWWLGMGGGVGIREPVVTEPRWLSSSSMHVERENGLSVSGGEKQLQCAKMDSTFRWRCNILAVKGSKFCQEHTQESRATESFVLPSFPLASEAAPSSLA